MPIIKSAIKKLRKDIKREKHNDSLRKILKDKIKEVKKNPSEENMSHLFSLADKTAKKHIIHKNKAARIKSRISKLLSVKTPKSKIIKKIKKNPKKSPKKK